LQGLARKNLPAERCFTEGNKLQHPATTGIGGVKPGLRLSRGIVQNERFGEGRREMAPSPIILSFQPLRKEITKQKADRSACPLKERSRADFSAQPLGITSTTKHSPAEMVIIVSTQASAAR
jgi:hypothetical protein